MTDDGDIQHIIKKLDEVHEMLTGNGTPSKGLIVRVDRLEQGTGLARWFLGVVIVALVGLLIGQIQLTQVERSIRESGEATSDGR